MKSFLLAAAALIAAPALAQNQPAPASEQATIAAEETPRPTAPGFEEEGGPAMGGYEPAEPALKGTPQPGSRVVFQPAPPPSVAFPPPPPMKSYPPCKKGQYNNCMQRGGK